MTFALLLASFAISIATPRCTAFPGTRHGFFEVGDSGLQLGVDVVEFACVWDLTDAAGRVLKALGELPQGREGWGVHVKPR